MKETGADALKRLLEGNARFVAGELTMASDVVAARKSVSCNQKPFAAVITCSDSRVVPELVFDQSLGCLFVVRTAGHVLDGAVLGSVEYAVHHLGVRLFVVLGHTKCGAVNAAASGKDALGHIANVIDALGTAMNKVEALEGDRVENATLAHIEITAERLRALLADVDDCAVVGMLYDLETGLVSVITS